MGVSSPVFEVVPIKLRKYPLSYIIIAFVLGAFLVGLLATIAAVILPKFRTAAIVVALLGFISAGSAVGVFLLMISRMG